MKEELIRVLNNKLNNINSDIDALKKLNNKIDEQNEELSFVDELVNAFNDNGEKNPMNFDRINKEDFSRALEIAGDEVKNLFNSGACNYDGLIYLISGIKNGVSIALTNEQMNGIEYFIQALTNKKGEIDSKIEEFNQEKNKYEISDVNELKTKKDKYEDIIDGFNKKEYIKDIDLLKEAIGFANLSSEDTINILTYILEYNADLYKENKPVEKEEPLHEEKEEESKPEEEVKEETVEENEEESKGSVTEEESNEEEKNTESEEVEEETVENKDLENENSVSEEVSEPEEEVKEEPVETGEDIVQSNFSFNQVENDNLFDLPNITFSDSTNESDDIIKPEPITFGDNSESIQEFTPIIEPVDVPVEEKNEIVEENKEEDIPVENEESPIIEENVNETPVVEETPVEVDNDFKDIINEKVDYETREKQEEEKTSTRELHKIFSKYGIEENVILNELIDGNVTEYQNILDSLKEHAILDIFKKNKEFLIETLLYSDREVIDKVLKIVKEDLSVDDDDYEITLKIVINTIPSIFIKEGGNYDNFVKNVELFKNIEINLINLFDFSKEILIADHESIERNLAIVNKYDFDITYKNAKYLLLIPNIAEKMDYYIESVYQDKTKNETFDGIKYIKEYAAKLNVVTDETIKRLRYASMNGKKVFGNKPGSLTGEITNLKVNALDLNDEYLNTFFNNNFANISADEVREYIKLIHNSSNVGNYDDELQKLDSYRNGLRYTIEGINISYNKVVRNYNVLRSYGIDSKKALQFAVCYNLIITKDEYNKLADLLDKIGGNV